MIHSEIEEKIKAAANSWHIIGHELYSSFFIYWKIAFPM